MWLSHGLMQKGKIIQLVLILVVSIIPLYDIPFAPPVDVSEGHVLGVSSMDSGDIDGDGRADVVVLEGGKHAGGRQTFAWYRAPSISPESMEPI